MNKNINDLKGIQPELRKYLDNIQGAMAGDLVFAASPATVGASAATPGEGAWTRSVVITLKNAAGEIQEWFTKTFSAGLTIADTASATTATATIASTDLAFVNGSATVTVTGSAGTWASGDTDTLTVKGQTVLGYTLATKTSVETFYDSR